MKIDVTKVLTTLDGEPIKMVIMSCPVCGRAAEDKGVRTLRNVFTDVLTFQQRDDTATTGDEKMMRYSLALRIHNEDMPHLTLEEAAFIKKLVGERFGALIVGQVWPVLDPPDTEDKEDEK